MTLNNYWTARRRCGRGLRGVRPDEFLEGELRRYESAEVRERTKGFLESPSSIVLVAGEEGRIVGFAEGSVAARVSRLGVIGVREEYRGRGIGYRLLEEFVRESKRRGTHKVYLWTPAALKPAIRLYVEGHVGSHVAQVSVVIDCGTADIHPNDSGVERLEGLEPPTQGIVNPQHNTDRPQAPKRRSGLYKA